MKAISFWLIVGEAPEMNTPTVPYAIVAPVMLPSLPGKKTTPYQSLG
jgi:hypothetical protein